MVEWREILEEIAAPQDDIVWLSELLSRGASIIPEGVEVDKVHLKNYSSAQKYSTELKEFLDQEVSLGHLVAYHVQELQDLPIRIHPIAFIPKPDQPGKFRLVVDMSLPKNNSINSFSTPPSFRMVTIEDVAARVAKGYWAAKVDVAHAFRNLPVRPDHNTYMGMRVGDMIYLELRLPMGYSWSPFIWNRVSDYIQRYCATKGYNIVVYCDDFLCLGKNEGDCEKAMQFWLHVLEMLNVPVKFSKLIGPTQSILFLGFLLDFKELTVSISEERKEKITKDLKELALQKRIGLKRYEKLVGKLVFVSQVIWGARTFLRRILDAKLGNPKRIRISNELKADVSWWIRFINKWNGKALLHHSIQRQVEVAATDASDLATGFVTKENAISHCWDKNQSSWHINIKELWSVYHGLLVNSRNWAGKSVNIACDNTAVVSWLNSGTARSPQAMAILRKIWWCLASNDIRMHFVWIPTNVNTAADAASRLDGKKVFESTKLRLHWHLISGRITEKISHATGPSAGTVPSTLLHDQLFAWLKTTFPSSKWKFYKPQMHLLQNVFDAVHGVRMLGFAWPLTGTPLPSTNNS